MNSQGHSEPLPPGHSRDFGVTYGDARAVHVQAVVPNLCCSQTLLWDLHREQGEALPCTNSPTRESACDCPLEQRWHQFFPSLLRRPKKNSTGLWELYITAGDLCDPQRWVNYSFCSMLAQFCGSRVTAAVMSMDGPAQKLCSLAQSAFTLHISDPQWPAASSKCGSGCWFSSLKPLTVFVHYSVQMGIVFSETLLLWSWPQSQSLITSVK